MIFLDEGIRVFEYYEAEREIARIAEENNDDTTTIYRGGRKRNGITYFNYPCAFDIETTTIRSGQLDYSHPDGRPLAFPYLFQFNIYGSVIFCRQYSEALDVFSWLSQYFCTGAKKRLVIFDHNLGYEYGFFKDLWQVDGKQSFALEVHKPVTLVLQNGLMLRDSYKMSNMSLLTFSKDWAKKWKKRPDIMEYDKLRTPYDTLDNNTLLYSALDVLALSDAMQNFLAAHNTGVWTNSPTSTSFIRQDLKKRVGVSEKHRSREQKQYFKTLERCKLDAPIYDMLTRQARGGNTHANRRITGQLIGDAETASGVAHFDITSSYPAQMVCYAEYPIHYWQPLEEDTSIDDIKLLEENGYCCLFDIVLINPEVKPLVTVPYLPISKCRTLKGVSEYSDNGRYLRGAEMVEITIFGIEWPIIEAQYNFSDLVILRGYFARKSYLPDIVRSFIIELYAKKTELKGVADKAVEYSLAKTFVNGVYGMAFTRIIRPKCYFLDGIIIEGEAPETEKELDRFQRSTSYFLPYAWGAMTATLGRVYLQKMIDAAGDHFLYCDTDSVFASHPEAVRPAMRKLEQSIKEYQRQCGIELTYYDIKGKPHELGGIDEEPECAFMTYGAKKYITVEADGLHCTIAGVPKKPGAKIIGSPDGFTLGMCFAGRDTGKNCLWYNDDENITLHDAAGRPIRVYSNIAMLPVDYILSLSDDYTTCLQIEGINRLYSFNYLNENMNEEYI